MNNLGKVFKNGVFSNNPVLVQLVGYCSVLAVTTSVINAIGMSAAVIFVATFSNIVVSALRDFIPDKVRIPAYIVVIATFVTLVQMFLQAFIPPLYESLGLFIPLIVVNCLIFGRAEGFASDNAIIPSAVDGFANALGYSWVIVVIAAVRELLGSGTLLGMAIIPEEYTIGLFAQAPGAFIVLAMIMIVFNIYQVNSEQRKEEARLAEKSGDFATAEGSR